MRCRQQQNVRANLSALRILVVDLPACRKENAEVEDNQGDGNDRPAAAFHVFMAQRNQHRSTPSPRSGGSLDPFSSNRNETVERNSCAQCRSRLRTAVTGLWDRV